MVAGGRDILLVYSDSPIWHDYIEERILPHLGERAVVLNWSQCRQSLSATSILSRRHTLESEV